MMKNNGKCQTLHIILTSNVLLKGGFFLVNSRSKNPRHPISSNPPIKIKRGIFKNIYFKDAICSPPTMKYGSKDDTKTITTINIYHFSFFGG
ncbi:hypothetical protein GCM10022410_19200 [Amphibacillus indicireducens]|uniref:Uncharacterized protein n=1 Tax=Amphibacillus indicireducens TaxID=1076330 RepID=A0ABP7VTE0_9BACI